MNKALFDKIEAEMKIKMSGSDSAHDANHVYRVLSNAFLLSEGVDADMDILIASVLLHDIGRQAEYANPNVDHALVGAEMAYDFLMSVDFGEENSMHVRDCILSHRFSLGKRPESIEAQILYDADKLDLTGCMAIVRGILAGEAYGEPLYVYNEDGSISHGLDEAEISFMAFYNSRLKIVDERLFSEKARLIARNRLALVESFYNSMVAEISKPRLNALLALEKLLK